MRTFFFFLLFLGSGAPLRNQNNEPVSRLPKIQYNLWQRYSDDKQTNGGGPPGSPSKDPSFVQQDLKKQEVLNMIEAFANNKSPTASASSMAMSNQAAFLPQKRSRHPEHRYDPITRDHIRPETYWNDWYQHLSKKLTPLKIILYKYLKLKRFGRPGAGAPNMMAHKKNLSEMLEPRGGRGGELSSNMMSSPRYVPSYQPSMSTSANSLYPLPPPPPPSYTQPANFNSSNNNSMKLFRSNHFNNYEMPPPSANQQQFSSY